MLQRTKLEAFLQFSYYAKNIGHLQKDGFWNGWFINCLIAHKYLGPSVIKITLHFQTSKFNLTKLYISGVKFLKSIRNPNIRKSLRQVRGNEKHTCRYKSFYKLWIKLQQSSYNSCLPSQFDWNSSKPYNTCISKKNSQLIAAKAHLWKIYLSPLSFARENKMLQFRCTFVHDKSKINHFNCATSTFKIVKRYPLLFSLRIGNTFLNKYYVGWYWIVLLAKLGK